MQFSQKYENIFWETIFRILRRPRVA